MGRWIVFKDVVRCVLSPRQWLLRADRRTKDNELKVAESCIVVQMVVLILSGIDRTSDPFTLQGVI